MTLLKVTLGALRSRQEELWHIGQRESTCIKKMLAVVVADVEVEGEYEFERSRFGATPEHLRLLAEWLLNGKWMK